MKPIIHRERERAKSCVYIFVFRGKRNERMASNFNWAGDYSAKA